MIPLMRSLKTQKWWLHELSWKGPMARSFCGTLNQSVMGKSDT
jgi:hypothetical protein